MAHRGNLREVLIRKQSSSDIAEEKGECLVWVCNKLRGQAVHLNSSNHSLSETSTYWLFSSLAGWTSDVLWLCLA